MSLKEYWDEFHKSKIEELGAMSATVSSDAVEVEKYIGPNSNVLELGCGNGYDTIYFAKQGHSVRALDVSQAAIDYCHKTHSNIPNITFQPADLVEQIQAKDEEFDLVYARLSLHYFNDAETRTIIEDVHRILKPSALFFFMCKSKDDPNFAQGDYLEENMFSNKGQIRHFFDTDYCHELCAGKFTIKKIEAHNKNLFDEPAAHIEVLAEKL